jgi:tetratricopeptide (TPR) repeat protein
VPGKAGLARPSLDTGEATTEALAVAPRLAAAMIGDRNDPLAEICLLERKAATALEACELLKAIHFYTDLIKKLESLDDEKTYWMWMVRGNLGMSDTRLRLGGVQEADEWLQSALELVMAMQSEDPAESLRVDVRLFFHQSDVEKISNRGKVLLADERKTLLQEWLLWADVKVQEAAVLVAKTIENGDNLYLKALEILLRVASVLQEVLGPESGKVAAALRNAAEVQALRGRFRDALDIYKRALRIETRATGYDGYAVWIRGSDATCAMMYS